LRGGALSVQGIAEELGVKEADVRTPLNRGRNKRFVQNVGSGTWGLMAHNTEDEPTHSESEEEGVTPMAPVRGASVTTPVHNKNVTPHNSDEDVMPPTSDLWYLED